jgi:hypothetical protein
MFGTKNFERLTKEAILERISAYDIFNFYIKGFEELGKVFHSELREDNKASCTIYATQAHLYYKDFSTGKQFDCFTYVQEKYGLNFREALQIIANDFSLNLGVEVKRSRSEVPIILGQPPKLQKPRDIKIVPTKWNKENLSYWEDYSISQPQLEKFNVKPIKGYYLDSNYFNIKENAYAYCFGNYRYKILRPESKDFKWMNNAQGAVQGLNQLTPGGILLITSSLKDVIVIDGIADKLKAIAPQSETAMLPMKMVNSFKEKFEKVILYYDNDEAGIRSSREHSELYGLPYIVHPEGEPKDPSDYVKNYNINKYEQLLWDLIATGQQEIIMNA